DLRRLRPASVRAGTSRVDGSDSAVGGRIDADLNAGAVVWLRGAVLVDRLLHFLARLRDGVLAYSARDRVGGFAREILADEILDEDREELTLIERRVRLTHRIAGGRPHLPLHLVAV